MPRAAIIAAMRLAGCKKDAEPATDAPITTPATEALRHRNR